MSGLKRVRDWRSRLAQLIEDRRREPFSEENNCALFGADCVQAMTGVDLAKNMRGQFTTIAEGLVLLRRAGFDDVGAFLADRLEEIHPSLARAGDVAVFEFENGQAIGIFNGEKVTAMGLAGIGSVDRVDVRRAFRIP